MAFNLIIKTKNTLLSTVYCQLYPRLLHQIKTKAFSKIIKVRTDFLNASGAYMSIDFFRSADGMPAQFHYKPQIGSGIQQARCDDR